MKAATLIVFSFSLKNQKRSSVMKNSAICIKTIPYQELIDLRDTLERLESWQEPLSILETYFTNAHSPINKKQVVKQYYACAELFQTFHSTYKQLLDEANVTVTSMTKRQTLKFTQEQ
jgi:hypothetical protein